MAFADTAKLIVEMGFRDKITGGLGRVQSQLGGMDRTLSTVSSRVSRTSLAISTAFGIGLERAVTGGISAFIGSVRTGVEEMQELQDAQAQTQAAIRSTGGVAGQTAQEIRDMSEAFEAQNALIDDKVIQAGANVLLTFTKIREDAFEPTLEAALDLSTRFKQDLQTSIVQIGKAMNDPIRNLGALQRAGIQFTDAQRDQIKTLVESNRLYEAQAIILDELQSQVGGSFLAQGGTDAARAAALTDRLEDLKRVLAEGLEPGLVRTREALIQAFDNPAVIAGVRKVGEGIADFLSAENLKTAGGVVRDVFGFLGEVPWGAIGDGLRLVGSGAKLAIDAFNSLPKEVQGVVIAGLAVNRLAGGVVGNLAGAGIKALFNSLRTIVAGNVTVIGKSVVGPTGGVPGGAGGGLLGGLKTGAALASPVLAGVAAVEVINFQDMRNKATATLEGKLDNLNRNTLAQTEASIDKIQAQIDMERPFLEGVLFNTNVKPILEEELAELRATKAAQQAAAAQALQADHVLLQNSITAEGRRYTQARDAIAADRAMVGTAERLHAAQLNANSLLAGINAKNFSPTVAPKIYVNTRFNLSSSVIVNGMVQNAVVSGTSSAASGFSPI